MGHPATRRRRGARSVLAAAAALALLGACLDTQALTLGAIAMSSALGEPLRAEIELPQISPEEAASLQAAVAPAAAFHAAGVEYSPALAGARISLHRRANGQAYLRLGSHHPVHEPVLAVVVEASWSSGHVVRNYVTLVNPRAWASAAPVAVAPAQVSPAAAPATTLADAEIRVQHGDTASELILAHTPAEVSLDQMLIALLRANPHAFVADNVNRMKAGVVLRIPDAEQAGRVPRATARRALLAQHRDFDAFRRTLARHAVAAPAEATSRSASGAVQAQVTDGAESAPMQDRLTLSRDSQPTDQESELAQLRQAQEQTEQVAQLNQNISELSRLQAMAESNPDGADGADAAEAAEAADTTKIAVNTTVDQAAAAPAEADQAAAPAEADPAAVDPTEADSAETDPAAESASEAAPQAVPADMTPDTAADTATVATTDAAPAAPATPAAANAASAANTDTAITAAGTAPTATADVPSSLASLPGYPELLWAGGGLLALLALLGLYRSRRRRQGSESPHAPHPAATGPDTASTGADTPAAAKPPTIAVPDQDAQTEQALKDAIRAHRLQVPSHRKLAELYVQRGDAPALEAIAVEAFDITQGEGQDWQAIASLGRQLDPDNTLYALGDGAAAAIASRSAGQLPGDKTVDELFVPLDLELEPDEAFTPSPPATGATAPAASFEPLDFSLDLDLPGADDQTKKNG